MSVTFHPFARKWAQNTGSSCRSLAAAALLVTIRHHPEFSIGPGKTVGRNGAGISVLIDSRRAAESIAVRTR